MSRCADKIVRDTITLLCFVTSTAAIAQDLEIYGGAGYASYTHKELKDYQTNQQRQAGINARIVEQFPAFYTYMGGFNLAFDKWTWTAEIGHGSTGGRVYYEDYSGKLIEDILVSYNYYSAGVSFFVYKTSNLNISLGARLLIVKSKLSIRNSLTIGASSVKEDNDFYGVNLGMQPNIAIRKYLGRLVLQGTAGYEIQNNAEPQTKDKVWLNDGSGQTKSVHLQGNGFRLSLCVGVRLGLKSK